MRNVSYTLNGVALTDLLLPLLLAIWINSLPQMPLQRALRILIAASLLDQFQVLVGDLI